MNGGFITVAIFSLILQAACSWALGQIGRHTAEHALKVAEANVLPHLLSLYLNPNSSEALVGKVSTSTMILQYPSPPPPFFLFQSKKALKNILTHCVHLPALEPLLHDAPPNILKHVVNQFSKVLPHDATARKLFVTSGGLKKVFGTNSSTLC